MKRQTIYIINKDKHIRNQARDFLNNLGYSASAFASAADATSDINNQTVDMIVTDISTDKDKPHTIISTMREYTDAPVIIYTSDDSIDSKIKAYRSGCDDYLSTSCDIRELELRIKACAKRALKNSNLVIDYSPLMINIKTREVTINGESIKLTNREFEILNLLVDTPNKTISIGEIYAKVWGDDLPCDSHIVMVNISYLRKKMEKVMPDMSFIKTEWGVGYSFSYPPIELK
ncbi:MAG: response regulator transcription factor [Clostridiales bacterium]|nr:response regulator transcription factor [Clostridiales bacterium]